MLSIVKYLKEIETGSTILVQGDQTDMKAYIETSPKNDRLNVLIRKNKFTGPDKITGEIDKNCLPTNSDSTFKSLLTPLERITKTRI